MPQNSVGHLFLINRATSLLEQLKTKMFAHDINLCQVAVRCLPLNLQLLPHKFNCISVWTLTGLFLEKYL